MHALVQHGKAQIALDVQIPDHQGLRAAETIGVSSQHSQRSPKQPAKLHLEDGPQFYGAVAQLLQILRELLENVQRMPEGKPKRLLHPQRKVRAFGFKRLKEPGSANKRDLLLPLPAIPLRRVCDLPRNGCPYEGPQSKVEAWANTDCPFKGGHWG